MAHSTFSFGYGTIDASNNRTTSYLAWLVRDGDTFAAPEPATLALLGVGLAGVHLSAAGRPVPLRRGLSYPSARCPTFT
ncbi:MAG: PEP-CTERM sorting domain-containing protein [Betaproteobacteria bacterium]|nr:PEP-CTERM sorting domain-containing protein [Betaproteobacteria bacterium]